MNISSINQEKKENEKSLQEIKDKASSIEAIGKQIASSSGDVTLINSYLPNKKVEEKIIGGMNYLASDAGVSLDNVSMKSSEGSSLQNNSPTKNSSGGQISSDNANEVRFSEATVIVSGGYDKIRLFIDQLQKMFLFNNIKSLNIYKKEVKNVNSGNTTDKKNTAASTNSSELSAEIIVSFGYLPPVKASNFKISSFEAKIDSETISVLKQYVSQKTESVSSIVSGSNKGRVNPFLP